MKKLIFLITAIVFLSCTDKGSESCIVPTEVMKYMSKEMAGTKIITVEKLRQDWKSFLDDSVSCPTMLDYDFTGDGEKDFICMIKDTSGLNYLIAFNNYDSDKLSYYKIDGVTDYGEHGIGDIIYLDKKRRGFYSNKLESSKAFIYWSNGEYKVDYEVD